MSQALSVIAVVLLVVAVLLLVAAAAAAAPGSAAAAALRELLPGQERGERLLREEMGRSRLEAAQNSQQVREDVAGP